MISIARNDTSVLGRWWWEVDRWTLFVVIGLAGMGVMLTLFASPSVAERIGADPLLFVRKQTTLMVPAIAIMICVSLLNLRNIRRLAIGMLGMTVIMLLGTLVFGAEIKGATRWISFGGVTLQPSEFAKPAFAVVAATFFSASRLGEDIPGYTMAGGLFLILLTLLLLQPDVGQAFVLSAIWFTQFFLAGLPMLLVIVLAVLSVLALIAAYFVFPHVQSRIDRFLNPESGDNYQVERSMEAFQNGGILGQGPGEGTVKNSLPDGHADFILAVAGEEFGLLFCLLIVGLYAFVVLRGFTRILNRNDLFVVLAATGLLVQFGLQALINMASTVNLIPTKGMTLPFLSYGGSSLIALALGMGMLLAITRTRPGGAR